MKSNTCRFAENELSILSKSATDPNNRPIIEPFKKEILALCDAFGKSGQSGGSAPYTATAISQVVKKLMLQEPICPITGIDDEWMDVSNLNGNENMLYQNRRCSAMFKEGSSNASAYYLDAIVWKTQTGSTWSGSALLKDGTVFIKYLSRQRIKSFPFTPKTFYIDVIEIEVAKNDWEFHIKSPRQLAKVFKYYNKFA
jgi:hypothetical protein